MSHCHCQSCCGSKSNCGCGCHSSHDSCCGSSCGSQKSCCGGSCGCQGKEGGCGCKGTCNKADKFLELADCAWMEVLKEKIKEHILSSGKNLDELARLIAEANHERWQKKMENSKCSGSFEQKLNDFFGLSCRTQGQGNQNKQR